MTVMAIMQDVDKCMRCNGCVLACKREWNLRSELPGTRVVSSETRMIIKSQKRADMGPFVRFSCWHCPSPPCAAACPRGSITKEANGAVSINTDPTDLVHSCNPNLCKNSFGQYPCQVQCQRGGYPKIGAPPYEGSASVYMNKCILCAGRAGATEDLDPTVGAPLQTRASADEIAASPGRAHEPACVSTCPAKAMKWDSRDNILAYLQDASNGYIMADGTHNWLGNGSMFWASKKTLLVPPKADPFVEDHVAPMTGSLLGGSVAKAVLLPTIVVGGLMALSARRARVEADSMTEGEV